MQKDKLTFLQIGLGSMGKRRIRNFQFNGEKDIIGFDFADRFQKIVEDLLDVVACEDQYV